MANDVWIFGYGSLVWRPAFPHAERRRGALEGWSRRFWQGSTDHRGVPEAPGRVVTLVPDEGAVCWGMVYRVGPPERDAVLATLDHRERGGFDRLEVEVRLAEPGGGELAGPGGGVRQSSTGDRVRALVYVATPDNPNYLGPAPLAEVARQVRRARGPSGTNAEYVLALAAALRALRADDAHVFALAQLVEGR